MRTASHANRIRFATMSCHCSCRTDSVRELDQVSAAAIIPISGKLTARSVWPGYRIGNAKIPQRIFRTGSRTSGEPGLLQRLDRRPVELRECHIARVPDVLHTDRRRVEPARREIAKLRE